uniref:Uncharacterized protein n=1 Tax=Candidatus Kentrum sp. LFY TaxID=2126342 RepID=A0A450U8K9_9GAMM|nr:MAG: hypothetical protein BECKLFY1418B_GA0070995_100935 [Candidatus Kentron sp. LFY]
MLDTYIDSFETAKDKQAVASYAIDIKNENSEAAVDAAKRPPCATFSVAW